MAGAAADRAVPGSDARCACRCSITKSLPRHRTSSHSILPRSSATPPKPTQRPPAAPNSPRKRETAVRNLFYEKILREILGYTPFDAEHSYTLAFEHPIRRGTADVALGRFGGADGADEIIAPFELKGPDTSDLDAIMPGRGYSPVQQAWNYAIDAPGCRWVLVSNCVEIRLYGFGRGRDAYELFDLTKLDDPHELERLWLLLSAERLLGGATEALLRATDSAYKDITDELYKDYKDLRDRLIAFLTGSVDGPKLAMAAAIEVAQKTLDRILFVAFAERTDLLPAKLLRTRGKRPQRVQTRAVLEEFSSAFR